MSKTSSKQVDVDFEVMDAFSNHVEEASVIHVIASPTERGAGVKFDRIRRITGYLVGTLDRFNNGKRAEEHDRVKHSATLQDELDELAESGSSESGDLLSKMLAWLI